MDALGLIVLAQWQVGILITVHLTDDVIGGKTAKVKSNQDSIE